MGTKIITDELKILKFPGIYWEEMTREDIVRTILEKKEDIEKEFTNNEYLKIDLTNKEIVGFKNTNKLGELELEDLPCLNFILAYDKKYKDANLLNLGNVNELYKEFTE